MDSELEQDVMALWGLVFAIVIDGEKRLFAHLASHDLTPPQFYVLKTLMEHQGRCPIGEIARQHHLTNATMTGLVKRLEAAGLVQRERNEQDLRSVYVVLTPEGEGRFVAIQNDLIQQLTTVLQLTNPEERKQLIHFLSQYMHVVTQVMPVDSLTP